MKAAALSGILRQIGFTFIVCLVFQVRVDDGRLVLLPLQAAALAWQLRRLRPFVASPEAVRAWHGAFGSAAVCTVVGIVGLIPRIEPGAVNLLAAILLLWGTISYASLLALWARRLEWPDAATAFERARTWCLANLVALGLAVAVHLVTGTPAAPGETGDLVPGVLLGRLLEGAGVIVVLVVVTGLWIGAVASLQLANRKVRAGLRSQPDAMLELA